MNDTLKQNIISQLSQYEQQGCSVNELFGRLHCSKTDFVNVKNQMIKDGIINQKKEGKQKIRLSLNSGFFTELDESFRSTLKNWEDVVGDPLKQLRRLKPLFEHVKDSNEFPGLRVTNQKIPGFLQTITRTLEEISQYIMVYTLQYHIDPRASKSDLKENQRLGFEIMKKIIDKLIEQHKDEEEELRNYLLWGTTSLFSYVL